MALPCMTAYFSDPVPASPEGSSTSDASTTGVTTTATTNAAPGGDTTAGTSIETSSTGTEPDPTTTSESSTSAADSSSSSSSGIPVLECVEALIEGVGSPLAEANTRTSGDEFMLSCAPGIGNDVAFQWIAPSTGYFIFDTQGSDFDTALALLDACEGTEAYCSDNANGTASSRIVARYEAGDQVIAVIDGEAGASGNAVLNINPVTCPSSDLAGVPLPASFTNLAGTNQLASDCGGDGGLERAFRYTATEGGLHRFRATSDDFPPVLNIQAGPECGGLNLQCNATQPGIVGSTVFRNLEPGDVVTIVVDSGGGTGEFELDVEALSDPCPDEEFIGLDAFSGSIETYAHTMSTSCGNVGEAANGDVEFFNAATFSWTSIGKVGTNSGCDIIYTGGFPAALSLQAGAACADEELQCSQASFDTVLDQYTATVSVGHIPQTDFTITLTQVAEQLTAVLGTNFTIEILCFAT